MITKFQEGGQAAQAQQQQILMQAAQVLQAAGYNVTDGQGKLDQRAFIQAVAQYGQEKLNMQVTEQNLGQVIMTIAQQGSTLARKGAKLNYLKKINNECPEGTQLVYFKAGGQICSKCEAMAKKKETGGVMDDIRKELNGGQAPKKPVKKVDAKKQTTWTDKDDAKFSKLKTKSVKSGLTPQEKRDSTNLQIKWNNASNQDKYEVKEGKCGGKMKKKKCGGSMKKDKCGSKLVAKNGIKAKACPKCGKVHSGKCGQKMKKHQFGGILEAMKKLQYGGSLNRTPFIRMIQ